MTSNLVNVIQFVFKSLFFYKDLIPYQGCVFKILSEFLPIFPVASRFLLYRSMLLLYHDPKRPSTPAYKPKIKFAASREMTPGIPYNAENAAVYPFVARVTPV